MANYPKINLAYAQSKYNLTPCGNRRDNKAIKYIVIHNTGTTATAENNCQYFSRGNWGASADYFINKDGSIYKFNTSLAKYYSWHCGDGYGKYGITNYNSIGIEVVAAGTKFTAKQEEALNKLVRALMDDFNIPASRVVRHYDASLKSCPTYYAGSTSTKTKRWNALRNSITTAPKVDTKATATASKSFKVKITATSLIVRKGPGKKYNQVKLNGKLLYLRKEDNHVYTIVDTKTVDGVKWGKLKSSTVVDPRWINLAYTKIFD